ncbi:hypothetical protein HNV10_06580 [Winogradskyella litoriviva]|uniref:Uncharacterized protein n=1 Tax=Winogradskyella litoriviva TaxID=1220182 RepID=A0ABX2E3Q6_9FLAO|nr:hypothetical protein [Winogradskyella litoriviva]NRD22899.1 hypothetical protein [Winogradskyella litoriviva]
MSDNYNKPAFKKLLEKLQEESWQLELLISGFAIFGLFSAYDPLNIAAIEAENNGVLHEFIISIVALYSCVILLFNLLLHVLLRGLWIGALGLRYVSGDIDYEQLNYSEKFTKYLKKRVGSFDKYIARLENYCSIIFAISFLLIFYVLALTFTILVIVLTAEYVISNENLPGWLSKALGIPLMIFIIIGMFLTFFDFATQGWLKKKRWISKIYFPFYWLFSFITLSFLYRPIVYNFLDNRFGKRLILILLPVFILVIMLASLNNNFSNYFNERNSATSYITSDNNYLDLIDKNDELFAKDAAIQSKIITENYINVYIKLSETIEDNVFNFNKGLKPDKDSRGLTSDVVIGYNNGKNSWGNNRKRLDSIRQDYVKTFNKLYYVEIDSLPFTSDFVVNKNKLGFETYLPTQALDHGKHTLHVNYKTIKNSDTINKRMKSILFWYYPD